MIRQVSDPLLLAQIQECLRYEDGNFFWVKKTARKVKVGKRAGGQRPVDGYWTLKLYGESYYVHRLVWLLHMGYLPEQLDHIDGNPRNNRIENIRECSNLENARNSKSRSNSRSKFKGVFWNYKKWSAQIRIGKDVRCLGSFLTEEEAAMSYDKAAVNLFGSFAKLNRAERTTV